MSIAPTGLRGSPRRRSMMLHLLVLIAGMALPESASAQSLAMQQHLENRVRQNPDDAVAWRLLAQIRERAGNDDGALAAAITAAELDPLSAAAQFDLGRYYLRQGEEQRAADCFASVLRLAPDSHYAAEAREFLSDLPEPETAIQVAAYEIRRFDRTDLVPGLSTPSERLNHPLDGDGELPPPLAFRLEAGLLFNSNVTLAPTSRELFSTSDADSFQGFISPELEYAFWNTPTWRAGPTFQAYTNINESALNEMDLISFRPGLFAERLISLPGAMLIPRAEYSYTHDSFGGDLFAQRHAAAFSNIFIWPSLNESTVYWVTDRTNYAADGGNPSVTSRDGWTNTLGLSHRWIVEREWLHSFSAGMEGQRADTKGVNFQYNSIGLFGDAEFVLLPRLVLVTSGGWAYRSYPDAIVDPSRNENVWRLGARLRYDLSANWSIATVASYDRFDSQNELFTSHRTILGVTTTYQY